MDRLRSILRRIDGRGYRAYKDLRGSYRGPGVELRIDHVQGDPFAEPSRVALLRTLDEVGVPAELVDERRPRVATEDFVSRRVAEAIPRIVHGRRGSGKSGVVRIDQPRQEILERTSCLIRDGMVEVRLQVGLPAQGRRILGREAFELLSEELPRVAQAALDAGSLPLDALRSHVAADEDQEAARAALRELGLVAFVAEEALLPRRSGIDPRPLLSGAVSFAPVPDSLRVEIDLPHAGRITGLGIPAGVTVIVGGGFHGKSTLLDALSLGIYNHVPGDGREGVVTLPTAMAIRAEDGRRIEAVDISPFISDLPLGRDTSRFCTDDASGSTSQAASILEAIELGAELLLLDEDTSANNFLVRDFRMQELVHKDREPITPFIDRVREIHARCGVSTILVLGGSSDYLDVADTVIQMDAYRPRDVSKVARELCRRHPNPRRKEARGELGRPEPRVPLRESFDPRRGRREERVLARETRTIVFGETDIEIGAVEQLIDDSQARTVGDLLLQMSRGLADGRTSLRQALAGLADRVEQGGLAEVLDRSYGNRAAVRPLEVGAAINRMRTLRVG